MIATLEQVNGYPRICINGELTENILYQKMTGDVIPDAVYKCNKKIDLFCQIPLTKCNWCGIIRYLTE